MGKNIVQKILDAHCADGNPMAGEEVGIRIDQTLTQDATGTMAYLQFESMGFDKVKTDVSVSYVDHNTVQEGSKTPMTMRTLSPWPQNTALSFRGPGTVSAIRCTWNVLRVRERPCWGAIRIRQPAAEWA